MLFHYYVLSLDVAMTKESYPMRLLQIVLDYYDESLFLGLHLPARGFKAKVSLAA